MQAKPAGQDMNADGTTDAVQGSRTGPSFAEGTDGCERIRDAQNMVAVLLSVPRCMLDRPGHA
eukprot:8260997-Lingulodinium_polyedra.AAC.1